MQQRIWSILLPFVFLAYSLPLFLRVLATTQCVIDEEFHLRQGLHFCNKRFDVWDPKITTFPGLYLFSLVLRPLNLCTVFGLRLISLVAATINVALLYKIRRRKLFASSAVIAALDSFTLAALPPLYFFSHLYYTDALSLTTVLLLYYFWDKQKHLEASVCGAASVLMRQTNVVWVAMLFGITALDEITKNYAEYRKIKPNAVSLFNIETWINILTSFHVVRLSIWNILFKCCGYLTIILPFIGFVYINGSIVIGDKSAHTATLHVPQLFYFSLFVLSFSLANTFDNLRAAMHLLRRNWAITAVLIGACISIAKWNTLTHPYLLSDNRHYIFYIWNRLYGRYDWFKYAITPVYAVGIALIHLGLTYTRDSFKFMFWNAVFITLCFQRLLELRYFIIPFVFFRLNTLPRIKKSMITQWLELAYYVIINAVTFYIFFTKEIKWTNFEEVQRIIW